MQKSQVGSKGELFPPKKIRQQLGLKPYTKIIYKIENDRLIIETIPTLEEVINDPSQVEITLEEFYNHRKILSQKAET
jgi:bifunctional DNA-binding transcriptional regulator/antitoxin component of YhaV-PrlF toxin-antitoxin module